MSGLSSTTKPIETCQRIVRSLDKNQAAPKNLMLDTNVLDRIMESDNRAGWEVSNVTDLAGKPKPDGQVGTAAEMIMQYELPFCPGGTTASTALCDVSNGTVNEPYGWLKLNIDKVAERHFVLSKAEYNTRCENPDTWISDKLRRLAFEIKHEINIEAIKHLHGIAGSYSDGDVSIGVDAKTIKIVDTKGNIINTGYSKILQEYRKANFKGKTLIFGGDMLATYMDVRALQGLSANSLGATNDVFKNMPFIYDSSFDSQFQTLESDVLSHGMSIPLGGLHMQEWYLHTGYRREVDNPNVVRIKMNIDGMEFDYGMLYDPCGGADKTGAWKFQLVKHYGFASIPDSVYCQPTGLNLHWIFGCGDFGCVDL